MLKGRRKERERVETELRADLARERDRVRVLGSQAEERSRKLATAQERVAEAHRQTDATYARLADLEDREHALLYDLLRRAMSVQGGSTDFEVCLVRSVPYAKDSHPGFVVVRADRWPSAGMRHPDLADEMEMPRRRIEVHP